MHIGVCAARQVRIARAMGSTYIQEKEDGGVSSLTVQVTEKASDNHREVIKTSTMPCCKTWPLERSKLWR